MSFERNVQLLSTYNKELSFITKSKGWKMGHGGMGVPIVCHFCGIQNSRNMEKIQERALRFICI